MAAARVGCAGGAGEHEAPKYLAALIADVVLEIERVECGRTQQEYRAPVGRDGLYTTRCFRLRGRLPGQRSRGPEADFEVVLPGGGRVRIWWGEHLGECMTTDRVLTPVRWMEVYDVCMAELDRLDVQQVPPRRRE